MSANSWPISFLPVARPHLGNMTWASSANRSRMLPPVEGGTGVVEGLEVLEGDRLAFARQSWPGSDSHGTPCRDEGSATGPGRRRGQPAGLANRFRGRRQSDSFKD